MTQIKTIVGDATNPQRINPDAKVIIPHVCNNIGGWGKGFVNALTETFGGFLRESYVAWHKQDAKKIDIIEEASGFSSNHSPWEFGLGAVQFVDVGHNIVIANMVAQHGLKQFGYTSLTNRPPIRYGALVDCMRKVADLAWAENGNAEIHCPKFGSDLAGGSWSEIEKMIEEIWCDENIPVTVYEFVP